jgi:aminoglycoside/choline kinase family phosphotransferase
MLSGKTKQGRILQPCGQTLARDLVALRTWADRNGRRRGISLVGGDRRQVLEQWLGAVLDGAVPGLHPASSDASARRYWRVWHDGRSMILMDAPPEAGSSEGFVVLARRLRAVGLNTPEVIAEDQALGLVLMSDLGSRHYLDALAPATADRLYGDAIGALIRLQAAAPAQGLPEYDAPFLRRELDLFGTWLLDALLGLGLTTGEHELLRQAGDRLIAAALEQPRVCVHRDYHSRNLMLTEVANPGILDFQDAVLGPVTYDLVSLLKDCYVAWPRVQVESWAWGYFELAVESGILTAAAQPRFLRWFDLMGAQRHLKAAGIFARLALRDGKPGYLADLPRTLGYVVEVASCYDELDELGGFVTERVLPRLPAASAQG